MVDRTPEQQQILMRVHAHNGLLGPIGIMKRCVVNINTFDSTTPRAKQLANDLIPKLQELADELKIRVDPPF